MGQEVAALEKPCPPRPSPAHLLQEPQARQETRLPSFGPHSDHSYNPIGTATRTSRVLNATRKQRLEERTSLLGYVLSKCRTLEAGSYGPFSGPVFTRWLYRKCLRLNPQIRR